MPRPGGSRQKQNLSLFGRTYYHLCQHLAISGKQLAKLAGVSPGAISRATRLDAEQGTVYVERATTTRLYEAMRAYAAEQGLTWDAEVIRSHFFRVAGYSTEQDQEESASRLADYLTPDERRNQPGGT